MTIEKEILVYASLPYKKFRWVGYLSLIQVGFIGVNLMVMPNPNLIEKQRKANKEQIIRESNNGSSIEEKEQQGIFTRMMDLNLYKNLFSLETVKENVKESPFLTTTLIGCTTILVSAIYLFTKRSIHTITLLPNERVRFQFFTPFAIRAPPKLEMSLSNVSCKADRKSKQNYSILKLRGYKGYHLVHKADGYFLEPKLYDKYLGYERVWKK